MCVISGDNFALLVGLPFVTTGYELLQKLVKHLLQALTVQNSVIIVDLLITL